MNKFIRVFMLSLFLIFSSGRIFAGNDTLVLKEDDRKVLNFFKHIELGLYFDVYSTLDLHNLNDTSMIIPLMANSMYSNDVRLNVASIILNYRGDNFRSNFTLQLGDIPMLLTKVDYQWIKYMRQANFGIRLTKRTWLDMGYMLNPIGYESAWPVYNRLSTTTIGGWYEPGNIVGFKVTTIYNKKFATAFYIGNPYSLAYNTDQYASAGAQIIYNPHRKFTIIYANLAGFQNRNVEHARFQLYNNLIFDYYPLRWLILTAQYDFAWETNTHTGPDTSRLSYVNSGFLQASVKPLKWFSASVRGEFYDDPQGFLSGIYDDAGTLTGLKALAFTGGVEFRPYALVYLRLEYRYADTNEPLYDLNQYKFQKTVTFTAGLKI